VSRFSIYTRFNLKSFEMFKLDSVQMPQQLSQAAHDREKVFQWIVELCNAETRENALSELRY